MTTNIIVFLHPVSPESIKTEGGLGALHKQKQKEKKERKEKELRLCLILTKKLTQNE